MVSKIAARIGLFVSLYGYGLLMARRSSALMGTHVRAYCSSAALALLTVVSVSLLIMEVRRPNSSE